MARAGEWANNAPVSSTATGFTSTTFDLRPGTPTGTSTERTRVALTPNLVGWVLQPDINKQVFAPITAVDAVNCSVTVGVDLASLAGVGKRWRIHAPPGSVTFGPGGGTSADFDFGQVYVSANSTRHLFAGYRYESPLAGAREYLTPIGSFAASGRQQGKNFTGQYYTLWRHYDPTLMRFTGPDPAAQFHYNLHQYAGNAPGRFFDPDGLLFSELAEGFGSLWDAGKSALNGDFGDAGMHLLNSADKLWGGIPLVGQMNPFGVVNDALNADSFGDFMHRQFNRTMLGGAINLGMGIGKGLFEGDWSEAPLARGVIKASNSIAEGDVFGAVQGAAMLGDDVLSVAAGFKMSGGGSRTTPASGPKCFVAGTLVLAAANGGTVTATRIEEIKIGDWVWSRDEETGEEGLKPVVTLFRNQADSLVHVTYTSGSVAATLTGTEEHPFWSVSRGCWVPMGELEAGETLALAGGLTATATAVSIERLATPVTVYNFEVADWHTYHVGTPHAGWVYVHNLCDGAKAKIRQLTNLGIDRRQAIILVTRPKAVAGAGAQYALVAKHNGPYPVMARGSAAPVASINLSVGGVWKYGQTKNTGKRYSQKFLDENGLEMLPQSHGDLAARLQAEQARLDLHRVFNGGLPPGNKIRR